MFYDQGCHGSVELGQLSQEVNERLRALPGEWLEYDPESASIVVRRVEPAAGPSLPAITGELVRMLSEIPVDQHAEIPGGDLFIHAEDTGQFARVRVEPGGSLRIHWAHPEFARAHRRPYSGVPETAIDGWAQRLNGTATLTAEDPYAAADSLQELADTFEGLYPEGHFRAGVDASTGMVMLEMRDVNLDSHLLVKRLIQLAQPRSLSGRFVVSDFAESRPEQTIQFVFADGKIWVKRPLLWEEGGEGGVAPSAPRSGS